MMSFRFVNNLKRVAAPALVATVLAACGASEEAKPPVQTQEQASQASGFTIQSDIPVGWGIDSSTGHHTGGSCWDLPSDTKDYVSVSANDSWLNVSHSWSSTHQEANEELYGHLNGNVDLGVFSSDLDGSYKQIFDEVGDSQVVTIVVNVRTVYAEFKKDKLELNANTCDGLNGDEMSLAAFLERCGDHYLHGKQMGGYIVFIGYRDKVTETERYDITTDLEADYGVLDAEFDGYYKAFEKMTEKEFRFHIAIFGFPELINTFGTDSSQTHDALGVWRALKDQQEKWDNDATAQVWPGQYYGATISQVAEPYRMDFYATCTGVDKGADALQCYQGFQSEAFRKLPIYEKWADSIKHKLSNPTEYYWGPKSSIVQDRKQQYEREAGVFDGCIAQIKNAQDACTSQARSIYADGAEVCAACDHKTVYHCDTEIDENGERVCINSTEGPPVRCTPGDLQGRYENDLPQVPPKGDVDPNIVAQPLTVDQYQKSESGGAIKDKVCVLGGVSGKMSGGGESVRVTHNGLDWTLATSSKQGDDDGEKLTGRAWCTLLSHFYDGKGDKWTTHPDVTVTAPGGGSDSTVFKDASGNNVPRKYATALNGVKGKFEGGGERATVVRGIPSYLEAASKQTALTGFGSAFGLEEPKDHSIERGLKASYSIATKSDPSDGTPEVPMIPVEDGFCYFHEISGDFDGSGEGVRIYPKDGVWYLRAKAACTGNEGWFGGGACDERKNVRAKATCYKYDQSF
jgi:hypothetical protein